MRQSGSPRTALIESGALSESLLESELLGRARTRRYRAPSATGGNLRLAAVCLGMGLRTPYDKVKRYQID